MYRPSYCANCAMYSGVSGANWLWLRRCQNLLHFRPTQGGWGIRYWQTTSQK